MEVRHFNRFGELVRHLRRQAGLSQRAMAKLLRVSPGYVGQWELSLSRPAPEVVEKLCLAFQIVDAEFVQRLAYAERAPAWLKDTIVSAPVEGEAGVRLNPIERRILDTIRRLPAPALEKLAVRVEGWVSGALDSDQDA